MPATPIMMNNGAGGGSSPAFPYPVYKNPVPTPGPSIAIHPAQSTLQQMYSNAISAKPANAPAGTFIGSGSSADVANGDKVYQVKNSNGSYVNNVYGSNGQLVASYNHNAPVSTPTYGHAGAVATNGGYDTTNTGNGVGPIHTTTGSSNVIGVTNPAGVPNQIPQVHTTIPVVHPTTQNTQTNPNNVSFQQLPSNTGTKPTNNNLPPSQPPSGGAQKPPTNPIGSTGGTSTSTAGSTGTQSGNGLDPLDASLFNNWANTMGNLGNTNNPVFQNEVQSLAQQLNDKYYQQWLTQRDKMGGQGLGQSGFLNNDQLREQMAEQNDLAGQYGNLLQNYLKDQLSQATNYSDMMKNMMPYYNLTAQNQVADQQNAQKLADAQLNAAGYADVNGQSLPTATLLDQIGTQTGQYYNPFANYSPTSTVNEQKLQDQYNLLTPDQYATLSGYLPSSYGGGATLANTNDALGRDIQIGGLTGLWNGQPTLTAQNDAATRGNAASSTQLSNDRGLVDALNTQIDNQRTSNPNQPIDPALMKQYTDALNKYYGDLQSFGNSGN